MHSGRKRGAGTGSVSQGRFICTLIKRTKQQAQLRMHDDAAAFKDFQGH